MSEKLKPCPFCGGGAEYRNNDTGAIIVCCKGIGCYTQIAVMTDYKIMAALKWNTRAIDTKLVERDALLLKARECLSMTHHQGQHAVDWAEEIVAEIDELKREAEE